jgi:hypothetical protein
MNIITHVHSNSNGQDLSNKKKLELSVNSVKNIMNF